MGERLSFYLSLGLFSSFSIDAGTRLLLKSLAQQNIIPQKGRILDAGCGAGIIAVSLKKRFPALHVTAADRDALALYFTEKNAKLNKLTSDNFEVTGGLLPGSLRNPLSSGGADFDLIVSNIPAKAGNPVIADFLQNCGLNLTDGGRAAVVIVEPLSDFAEQVLTESGAEITYTESNSQYTVFHFIPLKNAETRSFSDVYSRTDSGITGFFGLPEFDSISYCTKVTLEIIRSAGCRGSVLFWNPGTGHIPCSCSEAGEITLSGNDLLQLKAAGYNLARDHKVLHLPKFSALEDEAPEQITQIIAVPDFINGAAVEEEVIQISKKLLKPKGKLLVSGKSSDIARIEKNKKGFIVKKSVKYRGFRAVLLEKL